MLRRCSCRICGVFHGGSERLAAEAGAGWSGHWDMVGGSEHMGWPPEHFHQLWGHSDPVGTWCRAVSGHQSGLPGIVTEHSGRQVIKRNVLTQNVVSEFNDHCFGNW